MTSSKYMLVNLEDEEQGKNFGLLFLFLVILLGTFFCSSILKLFLFSFHLNH
jgi:hypothetical protein